MKHPRRPVAIAVLLVIGLGISCPLTGEESSEPKKLAVTTSVAPREVRDYKIDAAITGKALSPASAQPVELDSTFHLKVRHQYSRREGDSPLPLEISLLDGQMTVNALVEGKSAPQTLQITPSVYPKLTVLIDRDWRITDVLGLSSERVAQSFPGISYGNHIILFYLQGGAEPRAPGDKWESSVRIPGFGETYSLTNTLMREETIDGVRAAVVRQEIVRPPKDDASGVSTSMKASAESAFAIDGGKLLKSHVDCDVTFVRKSGSESGSTSGQDSTTSRANIRVDISPVK